MNEKLSLEYIAGFFDGEGSIHIAKTREHHYRVGAKIGNTDFGNLVILQEMFGGRLYKKRRRSLKHKQMMIWVLTTLETVNFLQIVLPYLRIKKERAILALEFHSRMDLRPRNLKLSESEHLLRDALFKKMTLLNKRGVEVV